jgi:hypothetical protein
VQADLATSQVGAEHRGQNRDVDDPHAGIHDLFPSWPARSC